MENYVQKIKSIRNRTILGIVATILIIISFSIFAGIFSVRSSIKTSQKADLMIIDDIANRFISNEVSMLKLKAAEAAYRLSASDVTSWQDIMKNLEASHPEFIGMAILDAGQGPIASAGELPAPFEVMDDQYIQQAFQGKKVLSSPVPSPLGIVFYLATPMPGITDKILVFTLHGMHFSNLVGTLRVWETGHISLDDAEGHVIANMRRDINKGLIVAGGVSLLLSGIAATLASGFISRPFEELVKAEERLMLMLDTSPLCAQIFWDRSLNTIDCNEAAVKLYGFKDKQEYRERFLESCSPEYQPDGQRSDEKAAGLVHQAFTEGYCVFDWMHNMPDGTPIPAEVTLVRAKYGNDDVVIGYTRDMREYNKMMKSIEKRDAMLQAVNLAAYLLLETDGKGNIEFSLTASMELVGRSIAADSVHIWRNEIIDGELHFVCAYSWFSEVGKQKSSGFTGLKYASKDKALWEDAFKRGESISGPLSNMPQCDQAFLGAYGIKSIAMIPLFFDELFWGHVSFVDCTQERNFTLEETSILLSASLMMASAISRQSMIAEMNEANERLMLMLDTSPLCAQIWDRNLNTIDCNEAAVKLYGFKDKQEYRERFLENCSPEYQPDGQRSDEKAVRLVYQAFTEGYCVFDWVHKMPDDGTPIPAEVTLVRAKYGDDDVVIGYTRDMREYNKMMKNIEKRDTMLETVHRATSILLEPDINEFESGLFAALSMLAEAIDVDRVCIWKNYTKDGRLYCTSVYAWLSDALSRTDSNKPQDVSYDEIIPGYEALLSQGKCLNTVTHEMPPKMQERMAQRGILSAYWVPIFLYNTFWGFVCFDDYRKEQVFTEDEELILRSVSRMITNALIRNEMTQDILKTSARLDDAVKEANEANRIKSDFLAKMSHEIRTPMNAVIGMAELALREDMPNTVREHVTTVKQAGVNLLSIINDILDFSKIESGNIQLVLTDYLLSSLINDVVSIIRMRAVDSQLRFSVNLDSNLPSTLIGDEARIRQVLINILGNAVKYTDKGHVAFKVYGEMIDESTINLTMEINDSGKGIKQEDLGKLFHNYFQLDTESNKDREGVGLGLAISWSIVKAMGGDITVHSEYGKGSTFTVTLPQKTSNSERLAAVVNPEEKTALVYERRVEYADSLMFTINNLGVQCVIVSSIETLCDMMEKDAFSFIFLSHGLFEKNKNAILKSGKNSQIVLLAEFGESIPAGNLRVLSMPAHAISIANIFNGVSDSFSYNTCDELIARFTAPDAKVLVVDDINTNLQVASGLLLPYKMKVDLCKNGIEAIRAIQSENYDLVFMDHRMPGMDGVETTEYIRALGDEEPYYKNVPIVALTANAVSGMKAMFLQSGFNEFLPKPIDTVKLNTILERWIPKEKQTYSMTRGKATNIHTLPLTAIGIEGIDIKKGIHLSGGTAEHYYETLAVFYEDVLERKEEIRKNLDAGNLPLYITHVHALKSASANIGADKVSEAAYALEMAGYQENVSFLEANNEHFLFMLEQLLNNISNTLSLHSENNGKPCAFVSEQFKIDLANLKTALEYMDVKAINKTVDNLLKSMCPDDVKAILRKISKHILMVEYDEANALIESLLHENQYQ